MSTPGNAAKQLEPHSATYTDSTKVPVPGCDRIYNALISILLSQRISPPCQSFILRILNSYFYLGIVLCLIIEPSFQLKVNSAIR